jgi:hypothetical protein
VLERDRRAGEAGGGRSDRDLRRRLLLVHGAALRPAPRRARHDLGLHGRARREAELRAGVGGHDRTPGSGAGRVRPGARELCAAARRCFWHNVDPTDAGGQFCDRGEQYTTAIFTTTDAQAAEAKAAKEELDASHVLKKPVVTSVLSAGPFYPAEDYHQDYYEKKPVRYKFYRTGCGRDRVLESLWGAAPAH